MLAKTVVYIEIDAKFDPFHINDYRSPYLREIENILTINHLFYSAGLVIFYSDCQM